MTKKQAEKERARLETLARELYYISDRKADEYYFKILGMIEVLSAIQRGNKTIFSENIEQFLENEKQIKK